MGRKRKYNYDSMLGCTYGTLTVVEMLGKVGNEYMCKCVCTCGTCIDFYARNLLTGKTASCGKCNNIDYSKCVGNKYGKLSVISYIGNIEGKLKFRCKCECGTVKDVYAYKLVVGEITTCGNCNPQKYRLYNNYAVGIDTKGNEFYIDLDDYEKVSRHKWYMTDNGYFKAQIGNRKSVYLHRFVIGSVTGTIVDHIDLDKRNCRKYNLRKATHSQNNTHTNKRSNTSSVYKGVCLDKSRGKWLASISHNGKNIYLGRYATAEEAAQVYNEKSLELYGEFAVLNAV